MKQFLLDVLDRTYQLALPLFLVGGILVLIALLLTELSVRRKFKRLREPGAICRAVGHHDPAEEVAGPSGAIWIRCRRCGATKVDGGWRA